MDGLVDDGGVWIPKPFFFFVPLEIPISTSSSSSSSSSLLLTHLTFYNLLCYCICYLFVCPYLFSEIFSLGWIVIGFKARGPSRVHASWSKLGAMVDSGQ
ncbi:hypothetical protein PMIN03_003937 [Paraphaeosphaeria minitans]